LVQSATKAHGEFNFAQALQDTEAFFWSRFTDTYLELAKPRAWTALGEDSPVHSDEDRSSAISALRLGLSVLLRLFAPILPYITEEIWSWIFAEETGHSSIHKAPWPSPLDFEGIEAPRLDLSLNLAVDAFNAINKAKADGQVSAGRVVESLTLSAAQETLDRLAPVLECALQAARVQSHTLKAIEAEAGEITVEDAHFAPKAEK
jgi:valyl-tRNA synthetase